MFKDKLKLLREEHHLSQVELANKIYVSRSAVAKWEQGRGMPSKASLQELCKLFNLTEKELLNEKEQYIYTFDYKKEKITKAIIIALVILIPLFVWTISSIVKDIKEKKPPLVNITNEFPGERDVILVEISEEFELTIDDLDIDERYNILEITNDKEYYEVKKGKIKFLKTGRISINGQAMIKEGRYITGVYEGTLQYVYCYDKTQLKEINTPEDFININNDLDGYYILNNNLDFSNVKDFESIGNLNGEEALFSGMLINPNNYIISNINMESTNNEFKTGGIFFRLANAYIDNLKIDNIYINNTNEQSYVGAIASQAHKSFIRNCSVSGVIKGRVIVGGIVGYITRSQLTNCTFAGEVHQKNIIGRENPRNCAGGLFGEYEYDEFYKLKINNNIVVATISSDNIAGKVGGIIVDIFNEYIDQNKTVCTLNGKIEEEIAYIVN